ncbi:hypothetical protein LEP1GSC043_1948 [Leptospira weilii str. Ecochallenge]|uniref:Uncharacterized protein n=1 Tax=Leptospira weilii str. Ecochallenge TaxID=1049986 RepID=N1U9E1_9LEPT|nr:hypothetical protein LEP1GSC043_1948 [Leptospira weilii str. Ecochallenge]
MYAFVDPIPLLMLKENLGENFLLWDVQGSIQYLKATSKDVFAEFKIFPEDLNRIQEECDKKRKHSLELKSRSWNKPENWSQKRTKRSISEKSPVFLPKETPNETHKTIYVF